MTSRILRRFDLSETQVSDAGLKELKALTNLTSLFLFSAKVTDRGLKELRDLTKLTTLFLGSTKVTDEGLKELKELRESHVALYLGHKSDGRGE